MSDNTTLAIGVLRARRKGGEVAGVAGVTLEGRPTGRKRGIARLVLTPLEARYLKQWLAKEFDL